MSYLPGKKHPILALWGLPGIILVVLLLVLPTLAARGGMTEKRTIYFGVIPRFNPHVMYEYYQPLMDYLSRKTPYRFELRIGRSYIGTIEDLEKGVTDVAYLGGATYALARHRFGARAIVRPLNSEGRSTYRCCVIVRNDSPVKTIADLKGRSFAYGAYHSTTGSLIPTFMLVEAGVTPADLKTLKNFHNHEEVARAVLKGVYDAGAVKDVVAWKYRGQGLRVIAISEELPTAPIAAGPTLSRDAEKAVTQALLSIRGPEEREALAGLGPELLHGFERARSEDYDFLYEKIVSIPKGCGVRCHSSNPFFRK
jgi:phosphonate transport system substrate-binding protein